MIVFNSYGKSLIFEALIPLMDDNIREQVHTDISPCTVQEFFDEYCKRDNTFAQNIDSPNPIY